MLCACWRRVDFFILSNGKSYDFRRCDGVCLWRMACEHSLRIVLAARLKESGERGVQCDSREKIYRTWGVTMKYLSALALSFVLGMSVAGIAATATPAYNRSVAFAQQAPAGQSAAPQQSQQQQQEQTFTGTMVKKSGQYLFVDDASKATHKLDHQQALSKYQLDGKRVEILGSLDAANNVIHIVKIALIRSKA